MEEFQYENLSSDIGIEKGDILDIASALRCIVQHCHNHGMHFDGSRLLDALQEAVGADGTIMVRAFTWDFCKKNPFRHTAKLQPGRGIGKYCHEKRELCKDTASSIFLDGLGKASGISLRAGERQCFRRRDSV